MPPRTSITIAALLLSSSLAAAQTTLRASVSSAGVAGNDKSTPVALSRDGRFVAFTSWADNLVAGDTNNKRDCFVRDLVANTTTLASVSATGVQGDQLSDSPTLSADGRYVVFHSSATNLVAGDTNAFSDIFRKDLLTGAIERVSISSGGVQADAALFVPVASASGALVAFTGEASNLVAGDTNARSDIFVRDVPAGLTTRVSVASGGAQGNNDSMAPAISADGRYVAFSSLASNLVVGDSNLSSDVFVHDRQTNTTTRVSLSTAGAEGSSYADMCDISPDGGWVAFRSNSSNLVAGDSNLVSDVFLHERATGITTRVSVDTGGVEGDGGSYLPRLSSEARTISFQSDAGNLVAGDTNALLDVFVRERLLGTTARLSISTAEVQGNGSSFGAWISADGAVIAYESTANNLVAGDSNNESDAFVRKRPCPESIVYCTAGTTSIGCVPAISSTGAPSATAASGFTLHLQQLEGQKSALIFYGINGRKASSWGPGSSSYLCVIAPTQRMPFQPSNGTAGQCDGSIASDWNAFIASTPGALGTPMLVGTLIDAQGWFRDPPAPQTTNLSNAIEFVVCY